MSISIQPPAMTSKADLATLAKQYLVTAVVQTLTMQGARLALLVTPDVVALARLAQALRAATAWEQIALGPALSAWLLAQAGPPTPRLLRQGVQVCLAGQDAPTICTDIDLLFEPTLQLDPLALLRQQSQRRPLAVCWPGTYTAGQLAYAVPTHAHYRAWSGVAAPDVRIFPVT